MGNRILTETFEIDQDRFKKICESLAEAGNKFQLDEYPEFKSIVKTKNELLNKFKSPSHMVKYQELISRNISYFENKSVDIKIYTKTHSLEIYCTCSVSYVKYLGELIIIIECYFKYYLFGKNKIFSHFDEMIKFTDRYILCKMSDFADIVKQEKINRMNL